jgi:hypothetical protein
MTKREENKLDKEIEKIYNKHGSGVQVDIFDISKIYKAGKDAHIAGTSIEEAVIAALTLYRKN